MLRATATPLYPSVAFSALPAASTNAQVTSAVDMSAAWDLSATMTLGNTGDTVTLKSLIIRYTV